MQLNVVLRCTHEELYSSMNIAKQSCCLVAGGGSSRMCIIHVVDVLRGHFHLPTVYPIAASILNFAPAS